MNFEIRGTYLTLEIILHNQPFLTFQSYEKIEYLRSVGIKHKNIILDPGIGFGKNLKHNMNLISKISIFHSLGFPILVGNSRKRFIKEIAKKNDSRNRIGGTIASSI